MLFVCVQSTSPPFFHPLEVICVGSVFSGMNFAVYLVSHFDYSQVHSLVEPSCKRDQKLFTKDLLYSGPVCLKFPHTSLEDVHKDIVLQSVLFTLYIDI